MQKTFAFLTLICSFLHRFRNEFTRSLTNGNHFSSIVILPVYRETELLE